jgi:4-hydroxybenzoate polyprenyltransferase
LSTSDTTGSQGSRRPGPAGPSGDRPARLERIRDRLDASPIVSAFRLTHPFPTLLDGFATAAIAVLAGGGIVAAGRLGLAMVAMQAAIGALNDIVDVDADRGHKPGKPLVRGVVPVGLAHAIVIGGIFLGVGLSLPSGPFPAGLAIAVIVTGLAYDLRLKGTAWSWAPFAVGIPLLPVYAWAGTGSPLPEWFGVLVPAGILAGAALAIANGLADVERDTAAGVESVPSRLGRHVAWRIHVVLFAVVLVAALATIVPTARGNASLIVTFVGGAAIAAGIILARDEAPSRRERAWELEAIGTGILAAGWIAAVAGVGVIGGSSGS